MVIYTTEDNWEYDITGVGENMRAVITTPRGYDFRTLLSLVFGVPEKLEDEARELLMNWDRDLVDLVGHYRPGGGRFIGFTIPANFEIGHISLGRIKNIE